VGPLVDIVQNGYLRADDLAAGTNGLLQLYFDHVPRRVAAALGHAVDQRFVKVEDQRLLVRANGRSPGRGVRRLAPWDQGPRGLRRSWEFGQLLGRDGANGRL
jgi:hypothetical protein